MRKIVGCISLVLLLIGMTGCGPKYNSGEMKESYSPTQIDNVEKDAAAYVKLADPLYVWKADDKELVGSFKRTLLEGNNIFLLDSPDSLLVNEGVHTLFIKMHHRKYNMSVQRFSFKKKHEYLVNYVEKVDGNRFSIYYWMEDLTEGKVVYGERKTKDSFK